MHSTVILYMLLFLRAACDFDLPTEFSIEEYVSKTFKSDKALLDEKKTKNQHILRRSLIDLTTISLSAGEALLKMSD